MIHTVSLDSAPEGEPRATLTRQGERFYSSGVPGWDRAAGRLGGTAEEQCELALSNAMQLVAEAGFSAEQVGLVTFFLAEQAYRPAINPAWSPRFPSGSSQPARKTTQHPLPAGQLVQVQVMGSRDGPRVSFVASGLEHRDPLPAAARCGSLFYSSVVTGQDPRNGGIPDGAIAEARQAFTNLQSIIELAGGSLADIVHVWAFLRGDVDLAVLVQTWLEVFPDDGDRPARKTIRPYALPTGSIQLQATGTIGAERRANFEVPGVGHHDPIPLAAAKGGLFMTSGVAGYQPERGPLVLADGVEKQAEACLDNLQQLMGAAGSNLSDVAHLTVLLNDFADRDQVTHQIRRRFPDESGTPSTHVGAYGLTAGMLVQLHAIGEHRQ